MTFCLCKSVLLTDRIINNFSTYGLSLFIRAFIAFVNVDVDVEKLIQF